MTNYKTPPTNRNPAKAKEKEPGGTAKVVARLIREIAPDKPMPLYKWSSLDNKERTMEGAQYFFRIVFKKCSSRPMREYAHSLGTCGLRRADG